MSYGNELYVVEVASETLAGHWTDMSEHSTLAAAVKQAELLQQPSRWREAVPSERIRIRQFEIAAVLRADGRIHVEQPATDRSGSDG